MEAFRVVEYLRKLAWDAAQEHRGEACEALTLAAKWVSEGKHRSE